MLEQLIKIKRINANKNAEIIKWIGECGNISGEKSINYNNSCKKVKIIQFLNNTRIWMLPEEIGIIN
uniref:Cytochrome b6-f complex subunit PetP n=1 Tax=Melanthalia intermedia TaxID=172989 RepID=A0A345UAT9_9FLOR|nr:hypothetical protein [Melanthalia intermedia]AXI97575.1 hypothetical protein [Melanthalia intermedia]